METPFIYFESTQMGHLNINDRVIVTIPINLGTRGVWRIKATIPPSNFLRCIYGFRVKSLRN